MFFYVLNLWYHKQYILSRYYIRRFYMKKIKLGIVGLGGRGLSFVKPLINAGDCEIVALCDLYPDRVEDAAKAAVEAGGAEPKGYSDYNELLRDENVEAVFVSCAWEGHADVAIASMNAGKITAMEVGGAYSIHECWNLVETYERTKTPFMFMENCCYDKFELVTTALVRAGKLGEIVHCHGAYSHDLRDEIAGGNIDRHYRLRNYLNRNCENYPTHELGPIAKLLNINRGNRMVSLVSMSSKSAGLKEFINSDKNRDPSLVGSEFMQGDIVTTIIKCSRGETITLTLDTTLPKYYSREFTVRGTKGLANAEAEMIAIEGECDTHKYWENTKNLDKYEDYVPKVWKEITPEEIEAGHGGIDVIEFKEFFKAIREGREMPIDIYDAASWMCISSITEASIAAGGLPQEIPDFTKGKWLIREPKDVFELPNPEK